MPNPIDEAAEKARQVVDEIGSLPKKSKFEYQRRLGIVISALTAVRNQERERCAKKLERAYRRGKSEGWKAHESVIDAQKTIHDPL